MEDAMKKSLRVFACAVVFASAGALHAASAGDVAAKIAAARLLDGVTGAAGLKSLRGAKAAWDEVLVQKGLETTMPSLETDLKTTDVEGALRTAGFRVMDPKKRSLAVGLRPTLSVVVIFQPKGPDSDKDFYLVLTSAAQDCAPLGGPAQSMVTWAKISDAIVSSGDTQKDIEAIRSAARDGVKTFIDASQEK
jgi:hypothetical protein